SDTAVGGLRTSWLLIPSVRPFVSDGRAGEARTSWYGTASGASDLHDLRFLVLQQLVERLRVVVGELLDTPFPAPFFIIADLAVLAELLQVVHGVPSNVSHRDLALLRELPDDLHELLAALLVRLRHREADHLPVVRRRQAEVGLLDRLLD